MTVVQLDLFGEIEAAELADASARDSAAVQAAAFLVETPWPGLLAWWNHTDATESRLDHGECKASYRRSPDGSPGWAWAIWRDGLRFEAGDSRSAAGGWRRRPRCCIPWVELRAFSATHTLRSPPACRSSPLGAATRTPADGGGGSRRTASGRTECMRAKWKASRTPAPTTTALTCSPD